MAENEKKVEGTAEEEIDPLDAFMAGIAPTVRRDMIATTLADTSADTHQPTDGQAQVKIEDAGDVKQIPAQVPATLCQGQGSP